MVLLDYKNYLIEQKQKLRKDELDKLFRKENEKEQVLK